MGRAWWILVLLLPIAGVQAGPQDLVAAEILIPPGAAASDRFGSSMDVAGAWMAVGAPGDGTAGSVHIYRQIDSAWTHHQELAAPAGTVTNVYEGFGATVAMSGMWLFVGDAPGERVQVYHRVKDTYTFHGTLRGGERFGAAITVSGDDLLVGAPGRATFSPLAPAGVVHHFRLQGGDWKQATTLTQGGLGAERQFGRSLDFDGQHLIIGAPARTIEDHVFEGYAWIYERVGTQWHQRAQLKAFRYFDEYGTFGWAVAIDGKDALVGSGPEGYYMPVYFAGELYAFRQSGSSWQEAGAWNYHAGAIDLKDGVAVVGRSSYYVTVMQRGGSSWVTAAHLYGTYYSSEFGWAVKLDGQRVLIGSPSERQSQTSGPYTGAVWVFRENLPPVADAGPDQKLLIEAGADRIEALLDGTASYDPDGTITDYAWRVGTKWYSGAVQGVSLPIGTHTIRLTVTDDLGATATDTVRIVVQRAPHLEAAFSFTPDRRPPGTAVAFTDRSTDGTGVIISWEWDFDSDGKADATSRNAQHRFTKSGAHPVTLTVENHLGKRLSITKTVTVSDAPPIAHAGDDIIRAEGATGTADVQLDGSRSVDPEGSISSYTWYRSGVQVATGEKPTVTAARGVTDFELRVRDKAGLTGTDVVRVLVTPVGNNATRYNDPPIVSFDWTPHKSLPRHVDFASTAHDDETSVALWSWDLDADGQSDAQTEKVTRQLPYGDHTVSLVVTDTDGASAQVDTRVTVANAKPTASFKPLEIREVPVGAPVVFTDLSKDPEGELVAWHWDFGDGSQSDHTDIGHVYQKAGERKVTLTVTDAGGLQSTVTGTVKVLEVGTQAENWTQEEALAAQERGEQFFEEPVTPSVTNATDASETPADEEIQESSSPWQVVRTVNEHTPIEFNWWWLVVFALVVLLVILLVARR